MYSSPVRHGRLVVVLFPIRCIDLGVSILSSDAIQAERYLDCRKLGAFKKLHISACVLRFGRGAVEDREERLSSRVMGRKSRWSVLAGSMLSSTSLSPATRASSFQLSGFLLSEPRSANKPQSRPRCCQVYKTRGKRPPSCSTSASFSPRHSWYCPSLPSSHCPPSGRC